MKKILATVIGLTLAFSGCKDSFIYPDDTELLSYDYSPAWSPNGTRVAYYHEGYTNDTTYPTGLYLIDTSGSHRRLLVSGFAALPDWSPDGNWITFTDGGFVYTINQNGDSLVTLVEGRFPKWSHDGKTIVYTRGGTQDTVGIWILDIASGTKHRIGYGAMPNWSPDGKRFVYVGNSPTSSSEGQIWLMDTSGNNRNQLTMNSFSRNHYPNWSHNSNKITWTVITTNITAEIWLMDSNGLNQRKLTDGEESTWSPNSQTILLTKVNSKKTAVNVWIVSIDGSTLKQLTF